jgi:hypothetical protein
MIISSSASQFLNFYCLLLASWSLPRDKKPHYPADNGYSQDNANDYRKGDGKIDGQSEDQIKERE